MYLVQLTIKGFRGIRHGTITFKRNSVLVAANNAGKTSIVEALALLLGRKGLRREVSEYDFHGAAPAPADRILIRGVLAGLGSDDPEDLPHLFRMKAGETIHRRTSCPHFFAWFCEIRPSSSASRPGLSGQ